LLDKRPIANIPTSIVSVDTLFIARISCFTAAGTAASAASTFFFGFQCFKPGKSNAAKNNKIIYLEPGTWYLSGYGLESVPMMIEEIAAAVN